MTYTHAHIDNDALRGNSRANAARLIVAGALTVACLALIVQFATGIESPGIPPGPIILGATALIVGFVRWRWIPALGLLVAAFLTVGAVLSGTLPRLLAPTPLGPFLGLWVQLIAQLVAIVAALVALTATIRRTSVTSGHSHERDLKSNSSAGR